jgi:hypothetical protein
MAYNKETLLIPLDQSQVLSWTPLAPTCHHSGSVSAGNLETHIMLVGKNKHTKEQF